MPFCVTTLLGNAKSPKRELRSHQPPVRLTHKEDVIVAMSAIGTKRTSPNVDLMSAFGGKADMRPALRRRHAIHLEVEWPRPRVNEHENARRRISREKAIINGIEG